MNKEIMNAILRTDFKSFVVKVFNEVSPGSHYLNNWHIDVICDAIMDMYKGRHNRQIINMPPRYMKSMICSIALPAWILGHNPKAQILCVSYNDELAEKFINLKTDKPQIFYIWGHSYEFDIHNTWDEFEDFARFMKNDYIAELDKKKPVVFCGDLNVAHKEIDLKNPKSNRKNPGFTDEERGKFSEMLESGFVDTFRYFYPDLEGAYSWWSYRFSARAKNAGWRIDYFIVSERLKDKLKDAKIHNEIFGSDHCPVEVEIEF